MTIGIAVNKRLLWFYTSDILIFMYMNVAGGGYKQAEVDHDKVWDYASCQMSQVCTGEGCTRWSAGPTHHRDGGTRDDFQSEERQDHQVAQVPPPACPHQAIRDFETGQQTDTRVQAQSEADARVIHKEKGARQESQVLDEVACETTQAFLLGSGAQEYGGHAENDDGCKSYHPRCCQMLVCDFRVQDKAFCPTSVYACVCAGG
jgi:hypothetical protein